MSRTAAPPGSREVLAAVGIVAATGLIFWPVFAVDFVSDDFAILGIVREHGGLRDPAAYFRLSFYDYYRPAAFLFYALDWTLWGANPAAFHATNLALHALGAVAVFALARRLAGYAAALGAALVFVVHPTTQETVFWIAGRFDLLATAALLVALWIYGLAGRWTPIVAAAPFAVALLSKESGIALLLMAAAHDVLVARRGWRATALRLVPLAAVAAGYVLLRAMAAGVPAAGGAQRAGKLAMLAGGMLALLWIAWRRERANAAAPPSPARRRGAAAAAAATLLLIGAAAMGPLPSLAPTVGFPWYALYYLGPLAWIPPGPLVAPGSLSYLLLGALAAAAAAASLVWLAGRWRSLPGIAFAAAAVAAGLLPVSAMPSRNHLYLGTAAAALLLAVGLRAAGLTRATRIAAASLVVAGAAEIVLAAQDWQRAGRMTRAAVSTMAADLDPCGAREIVLLVAPAMVRGVPCNLSDQAFRELLGCGPARLLPLLRVVGGDVSAVPSVAGGRLHVRVEAYEGNLVGTSDLRRFAIRIPAGDRRAIDTPIGRLTTRPDGAAQIFELTPTPEARRLPFYSYSDGAVSKVQTRWAR